MLPKTLDEVAAYPKSFQRAIVEALPRNQQAELWREHLAKYSGSASRLSPAEKRFIMSVSGDLDRLLANDPSDSDLESFGERATAILGRKFATTIFGMLGTEDASILDLSRLDADRSRVVLLRELSSMRGPLAGEDSGLDELGYRARLTGVQSTAGDCSCSVSSDFCDSITGLKEKCKGGNRTPTGAGCGWFWVQDCTGTCQIQQTT